MDHQISWVTSWELWRRVMGPHKSRQRQNVLAFLEKHPAILYWGDSWFSTPLYLNLARQSARRIRGASMIIGKPGAEATELFSEREVSRICDRIEKNPFDLVCLSAGGNDCLSEHLTAVFLPMVGKTRTLPVRITATRAYEIFRESKAFERVANAYSRVLDRLQVVQHQRPSLRVVAHPYVPIENVGQQAKLTVPNIGLIAWVKEDVGPWLWEPMRHVLANKAEAREFACLLLTDGFRDSVLVPLTLRYPDLFSLVDFDGVDTSLSDFWNDEIHPSEHGFGLLASRLNAEIRALLPPSKRSAVTL